MQTANAENHPSEITDPVANMLERISASTHTRDLAKIVFENGSYVLHALPEHQRRLVLKTALCKYEQCEHEVTCGPEELRMALCWSALSRPDSFQERLARFIRLHPTWYTEKMMQAVADAEALREQQ